MKNIKIKLINIVIGTTVTTIIKGQNNHTMNNNNGVEDICRLVGLPTHSSLSPPPTGWVV